MVRFLVLLLLGLTLGHYLLLIQLLLFISDVILSDEQPVAPVSSTSPGNKTESLTVSKAYVSETITMLTRPVKPVVTETLIEGKEQVGKGLLPFRHRSEGGLVDKEVLKKLAHLSLSQYDLLEKDVSFQPWGSENSVLIPESVNYGQDSIKEELQSTTPQESLSSSFLQCSTVIAKPTQETVDTSEQVDATLNQGVHYSDSEVAVTLIDTSQPGAPLSLHEPIKIVITMSSSPNSMTDMESSLHLKVIGTDSTGLKTDGELTNTGMTSPPSLEQTRIPVITLELPEDGGGDISCLENNESERTPEKLLVVQSSNQCSGYESADGGNITKDYNSSLKDHCETTPKLTPTVVFESEGEKVQDNLDPLSCKSSHEKRHARVLSVDSGTDVFLSKSSTEMTSDKEKTMPTSKSDLEAKEGQIPNESNFLEFVSLLESINTSKVVASNQKSDLAEQNRESGLLRGMISYDLRIFSSVPER